MTIRVYLDPGHGGHNHGIRQGRLYENDVVLDLAKGYVARQLGQANVELTLARYRDEYIPYAHRARVAEDWSADLAVLHHVNGMFFGKDHPRAGQANPSASGLSVFVVEGTGSVHEQSYAAARDLLLAVRHPLRLWKNRTTPHRSKQVGKDGKRHWTSRALSHLRHYVDRGIPALLVEWGFATNDSDRWLLLDEARRDLFYCPLDAAICGFAERRLT